MKFLRLGYTETTLLYLWYLRTIIKINNNDIKSSEVRLINWLFTTSGTYNKKIIGSYFDFDNEYEKIINSSEYNEYMSKIYKYIYNSDNLRLCFHVGLPYEDIYKKEFIDSTNAKNYSGDYWHIHKYIPKNCRLLIINSFAKLIKEQIESGNCEKIFTNFPKIISVEYINTPYTFFNNGPDNNSLETIEKIKSEIELIKDNFDVALVSWGSNGCLISGFIHDELNKDVYMSGGEITYHFGICSKRHPFNKNKYHNSEDYWIKEIPEEYKPKDYMKIEDGCYW
jgi:hypothetical protein